MTIDAVGAIQQRMEGITRRFIPPPASAVTPDGTARPAATSGAAGDTDATFAGALGQVTSPPRSPLTGRPLPAGQGPLPDPVAAFTLWRAAAPAPAHGSGTAAPVAASTSATGTGAGGSTLDPRELPEAAWEYLPLIRAAAAETGVDERLIAAVAWSESGFQPAVTSPAGAIGLMQLMPGTAEGLGVNPWDPAQNVLGGARYLASQLQRFGSIELALAAYNAGPGAVERYGGIPPYLETQNYVQIVTAHYRRLGGGS